ncbi:MAG: glycosyltransferase, partial [Dolichospermum sp.]
PEESKLIQQAKDLKINDQVTFAGVKLEHELTKLLNAHQIMVVPSLWNEPFGIVALEGIACGCVVVGSEGGGLKDAIGTCGVTFANGNVEQLTKILFDLLTHPE